MGGLGKDARARGWRTNDRARRAQHAATLQTNEMTGGRPGPLGPLLGAASEEAEDDTGGGPIVILMKVGAERGPVVVDIEQADVEVPGRVDIDAAAGFVGKAVGRSRVTAGAAD